MDRRGAGIRWVEGGESGVEGVGIEGAGYGTGSLERLGREIDFFFI